MRFSDRIGITKPSLIIQTDSMNQDLKNSLWNIVYTQLIEISRTTYLIRDSIYYDLYSIVWKNFLKLPINLIPEKHYEISDVIRHNFYDYQWYEIYNFIEFLANIEFSNSRIFNTNKFINECNIVLEKELSGYRFIDNKLVPIIEEQEIKSIENAIIESDKLGLRGVKIHLSEALAKLSDKKNPDYRNSIKESISAVESICQVISDDPNTELGTALKKMRTVVPIHGALEQGFKNLYGYTSNGDGIRHSLLNESKLSQEDAIYMIVTCSAFVNYLIVKASKAGILKT